uniref:DRBM domain-containing protein n=1 Tax=Wuchereria bancrofti TaxID=6293 RepID=A0A1I8EF38_WUCBA
MDVRSFSKPNRYVAGRLGVEIKFIDEPVPICPTPSHPITRLPVQLVIQPLIRAPFIPVINDQFLVLPPPRVVFGQPCVPTTLQPLPVMIRPPVRLILSKDFPEFVGKGITNKRAKNSAANEALSYLGLGPYFDALEAQSKNKTMNGSKKAIELATAGFESIRKDNLKSVITTVRNGKPKSISQIYECALHMRMNVEFLKDRLMTDTTYYAVNCKLISAERVIFADGEGSSKKIAKQNACSWMLTKLQIFSNFYRCYNVEIAKKKIGAPKELKRKTISKDMKMSPEYGHQINQSAIMQPRKQNEPKFQLVAERGQSRYKEFVMEVICDVGLRCEGIGLNKKLAKRAAAEAVLARIRYVKPMPKPGKSLLKRKTEEYVQRSHISMFELEKDERLTRQMNEKEDEAGDIEKVSEVTLSVIASMRSQVMAFANVDRTLYAGEQKDVWGSTAPEIKSISDKENDDARRYAAPQPKRRVTFNNEVSACPLAGGCDSRKWLTETEKKEIAEMTQDFFKYCNIIHSLKIEKKTENDEFVLMSRHMEQLSLNEMSSSTAYSTARYHLE